MAEGSTENARVAADGYVGGGYGDRHGSLGGIGGCAMNAPQTTSNLVYIVNDLNELSPNTTLNIVTITQNAQNGEYKTPQMLSSRTKEGQSKTFTAQPAKETKDERIVNLGLVIALLGLLSIAC